MCVRTESADIGNNFDVATVRFTESIQRHVQCPTREIAGATLREVLEGYFADNERARGYVLDDQGSPAQAHGDLHRRPADSGSRRR